MRLPFFTSFKGNTFRDENCAGHAAFTPASPTGIMIPTKPRTASSFFNADVANVTLRFWKHTFLTQRGPHSASISSKFFAAFRASTFFIALRIWKVAFPTNWRHVISSTKPNYFIAFRAMSTSVFSRIVDFTANITDFKWTMDSFVFRIRRAKAKVFKSIVIFDLIEMVYHLSAPEEPANRRFNNKPVLKHVATAFGIRMIRAINVNIAIRRFFLMAGRLGKFARHETQNMILMEDVQ